MKSSYQIALLFFFSIGLFSCQEEENFSPNALNGVYEYREFEDSLNLWVVTTYDFRPNGRYDYSITLREEPEGKDLGYRRFLSADYQWDGQTLAYQPENGYGIPSDSDALYVPRSQLESLDYIIFDYFRELKAELNFGDGTMTYLEIYPDWWSFRDEPRTFIKISK
ncbi:hypothetical protein [Algoriphagus namhaensis]